jgi:mRNA-degrading endonuclease toxin of MazEF toxin-antitoxin module
VREKNERVLKERMVFLSEALAAQSLAENQAMDTAIGDGYPLRIALGKLGKMKDETDALIDQIRAISNQRLMGSKPIAELTPAHMKRVEEALKILTGL